MAGNKVEDMEVGLHIVVLKKSLMSNICAVFSGDVMWKSWVDYMLGDLGGFEVCVKVMSAPVCMEVMGR